MCLWPVHMPEEDIRCAILPPSILLPETVALPEPIARMVQQAWVVLLSLLCFPRTGAIRVHLAMPASLSGFLRLNPCLCSQQTYPWGKALIPDVGVICVLSYNIDNYG